MVEKVAQANGPGVSACPEDRGRSRARMFHEWAGDRVGLLTVWVVVHYVVGRERVRGDQARVRGKQDNVLTV